MLLQELSKINESKSLSGPINKTLWINKYCDLDKLKKEDLVNILASCLSFDQLKIVYDLCPGIEKIPKRTK